MQNLCFFPSFWEERRLLSLLRVACHGINMTDDMRLTLDDEDRVMRGSSHALSHGFDCCSACFPPPDFLVMQE